MENYSRIGHTDFKNYKLTLKCAEGPRDLNQQHRGFRKMIVYVSREGECNEVLEFQIWDVLNEKDGRTSDF